LEKVKLDCQMDKAPYYEKKRQGLLENDRRANLPEDRQWEFKGDIEPDPLLSPDSADAARMPRWRIEKWRMAMADQLCCSYACGSRWRCV